MILNLSHDVLGFGIIFTKFELGQAIHSWLTAYFCCRYTKYERDWSIHGWVIDDLLQLFRQFFGGAPKMT